MVTHFFNFYKALKLKEKQDSEMRVEAQVSIRGGTDYGDFQNKVVL